MKSGFCLCPPIASAVVSAVNKYYIFEKHELFNNF